MASGAADAFASMFNWPTGLINCSAEASASARLPLLTNTISNKMTINGTKKLTKTMIISCLGDLIRLPCASLIGLQMLGVESTSIDYSEANVRIGTYNGVLTVFPAGARSSVDRVLASEAKGRRFDSCRAHQKRGIF